MDRKNSNQFIAGLLAGGGTTAILHPLDLLKRMVRKHGARQLYQGFTVNLTASMASWGLYFYTYERLKAMLGIDKSVEAKKLRTSYFLASGLAGVSTLLLVNPLWVAKTRICAAPLGSTPPSLPGIFFKIFREEGILGLYRGLLPGLLGVSHGAVQFTVYDNLKTYFSPPDGSPFSNSNLMAMSVTSKTVAMGVTYPYQVIRSRLQMPTLHGKSLREIVRRTWEKEGVAGFYRGILPSTIRVLPGTIITFLIYENVIKLLDK